VQRLSRPHRGDRRTRRRRRGQRPADVALNGENAVATNGSESGLLPEAAQHEAPSDANGSKVAEPAPIESSIEPVADPE